MKTKPDLRTHLNYLFAGLIGLMFVLSCAKPERMEPTDDIRLRFGSFTISEGIDYLADSLNGRYCRPGDQYDTTLVFADTFYIPVDGSEEMTEGDLETAALEIAEWAGDQFYPRGAGNKAPFMFEVRQAGAVDNDELPVAVWFIMEENTPLNEEDAYPYEEPWPYGFGMYIGCPTTPTGIDAPDLFRRDLRENITYGGQYGSGGYAYVRLYTICFSSGSDHCDSYEIPFLYADSFQDDLVNSGDAGTDNFYESPLFWNNSFYPNYHTCISDDEMNFHYDEMKDLAEDELGSGPVGSRQLVQVQVGYNLLPATYTTLIHSMQIYYANLIAIDYTPLELPSTCC